MKKKSRDLEKTYPAAQFAAKLRRLADALCSQSSRRDREGRIAPYPTIPRRRLTTLLNACAWLDISSLAAALSSDCAAVLCVTEFI